MHKHYGSTLFMMKSKHKRIKCKIMGNNSDDHGDSIMLIIIFDVETMNCVNQFCKTQIRNSKFK